MNKNKRVGINCTKKCNWKCKTCFYRWAPDFNKQLDRSLFEVMNEVILGRARGCDHAILVGWGEPGLWPFIIDFIKEVKQLGMTSSIITNGSLAVSHYAAMREAGLDHLHVSVHGVGNQLNKIVESDVAAEHQEKLFSFLKSDDWPWRMNMTVQKSNFQSLDEITSKCLQYNCRHIISLGFLPLYEWSTPEKLKEVAVHPAYIGPELAKVHKLIEAHNEYNHKGYQAMFTIRYHPMCILPPDLRRFVVNARYVLYDPWEWDYDSCGLDPERLWHRALDFGNSVANIGHPCNNCGLFMHCGGWNKTYINAFNGAGLSSCVAAAETQVPGYMHDQNPANHEKGYFG